MTRSNGTALADEKKREQGYPDRTFDMKLLPGCASDSIEIASKAIRLGHLVAFPTETVYGLGANALDEHAVAKIFAAKHRPADNPLIVHVSDVDMLRRLVPSSYAFSAAYEALARAYWPGPLTFLVPADVERVPSVVRCGLKTLGVRMPNNTLARSLISTADVPIAAPSANVSGRPSPTTAQHVAYDMTTNESEGTVHGRIPYILDGGACDVGLESTVIDGVTDAREIRILRPGGVSVEQITSTLEASGLLSNDGIRVSVYRTGNVQDIVAPSTPGMKYRHYSPNARVIMLVKADGTTGSRAKTIVEAIEEEVDLMRRSSGTSHSVNVGLMIADDSPIYSMLPKSHSDPNYSIRPFSLGSSARPEQAAQRLFDGLRTLDEGDKRDQSSGCAVIFVEAMPNDDGVCLAFMNRLSKAASATTYIRSHRS
jgi:L-threonylcarbamoyladenylate synthase